MPAETLITLLGGPKDGQSYPVPEPPPVLRSGAYVGEYRLTDERGSGGEYIYRWAGPR